MIVNPGIRRFLGSAIQRLFNSASVSLPLTHTAIPTRGDITPSFTRATTETGQKYDSAGYLDFTAIAGEVIFKGAMRIYNEWTTSSVSLASGANKSLTLAVGTYQFSMGIGTGTATFSGTGGATGTLAASASARVSVAKTITAGTLVITASVADLADLQVCNITGETDQTTIRPYVSVGVPADWAGDELVTNGAFDTDTTWTKETGWTIGGGVATHAAGVSATLYQGFNFVAGATYVFSWDTVISAGAVSLRVGGGYLIPIDFKSASGTYTATYTAVTTATDLLGFVCDAPFAGTIDNFSVKPAIYHGSMVDGVKCYDTDRSGNPISTSGSYPIVGYEPWEARTNLCLQSNAFGTAPWADFAGGATGSATQNAVGVTGASNTAWTLSDTDATKYYGKTQSITVSAGTTYTQSLFFAKTTGATTFPYFELGKLAGTLVTCGAIVNTNTGTLAYPVSQPATAIVTSHNALFWRVEFSQPTGTTISAVLAVFPAASSTGTTLSASVTGSCIVEGSQYELGAFATPYIPTTTVAVARNADVDQYPTTAGPIAAAGSIALDFTPYHAPSGTIALWGTYVDASNYTAILHDATNLIFRKRIAGSNYDATIANAFVSGTTYKVAATWGAAGTAIYLDGVAGTPHANTTAAQIAATMQVGADGNSLQQPGAGTTNLRIWQRQLSAPEGVAVTS